MLSVIALQKLHLHFTEQKALTFHRFHLEPECEDPALSRGRFDSID